MKFKIAVCDDEQIICSTMYNKLQDLSKSKDNWYWGINKNAQIQIIFDGLENLLHTKIQEDW